MKKRIAVVVLLIFVAAVVLPATVSRAAVEPYFVAVNDILLPFGADTMPYMSGSEFFVPPGVFNGVSVWSVASTDQVILYTSASRFVDFHISGGGVEDQDGNALPWPSARRSGNRFYVPLIQVCEFFELSYDVLDIGRDIIPQEQMSVLRIRPKDGFSGLNPPTFMGLNRAALRDGYNAYYEKPSPPVSPSPGGTVAPPTETPPEEIPPPPPKYGDVTVYHSFYNVSAGGIDAILELPGADEAPEYRFCFFVSADDIRENAGLIRKLSAAGHAIGIWLAEGTYDEYRDTSALLYEAARIKTVLVSVGSEAGSAPDLAGEYGLIPWEGADTLAYDDTFSVEAVTEMLYTESGARQNLLSPCSGFTALMLPGILSYLQEYEYTVMEITETVPPV